MPELSRTPVMGRSETVEQVAARLDGTRGPIECGHCGRPSPRNPFCVYCQKPKMRDAS